MPDRSVRDAVGPLDVEHRRLAREEHREALEPVRDLRGDRREVDAAGLLEVGELRDLHPVEQDLPADAPRAEGGRFPVVFLEADVVLGEIEADGAQRVEIELLHFERRRLEDHLKLVVLAEAEGVIAVTPVCRTAGRLDVADGPRLRPEDAEVGGGVHRAGAVLEVERRFDQASPLRPEVLQREDERLECDPRHWAGILAEGGATSRAYWSASAEGEEAVAAVARHRSFSPSTSCRSARAEAVAAVPSTLSRRCRSVAEEEAAARASAQAVAAAASA